MDDEEVMVLLWALNQEKKEARKMRTSVRFLVDDLCDESFSSMFRFEEDGFFELEQALQLPEEVLFCNGVRATGK